MRGKVLPALQSLMTFVLLFTNTGYSRRRQTNRAECFIRHARYIQDANHAESLGLFEEAGNSGSETIATA